MSIPITFNGVSYDIPEFRDTDYANDLTNFFVAHQNGTLQPTGGMFTLLAEVDFGSSFGIKSLYYKSRTANPASAEEIRLAASDAIAWRNFANSANLLLTTNASDELLYNGAQVLTGAGPSSYVSSIAGTANQVIASAATGPVTLSLPQSIATGSNVQFGTLGLGAAIDASSILSALSTTKGFLMPRMTTVQRDAIVSPATGLEIYNTDSSQFNYYNGSTWVTVSSGGGSGTVGAGSINQLAYYAANGTTVLGLTSITASRALESNASGLPIASTVTATELGYVSGVTSAIQAQINTKFNSAGGNITGAVDITTGGLEVSGGINIDSGNLTIPRGIATLGGTAGFAGRIDIFQDPNVATSSLRFLAPLTSTGRVIIQPTADGTDHIYTIPNALTDASFVLTELAQIINGQKTFTDPIIQNDTSNQIVLGVTNTTTINATAPAASRVVTIPDPGAAASFVMTEGTQTINGAKTFGSAIDASAINHTGGVDIEGTNTNDSAASGFIGEYIESIISTFTNADTGGTFGDLTSISLTAGDWDVTGTINWAQNGATWSGGQIGISTTAGNSVTGLTQGSNRFFFGHASSSTTPTEAFLVVSNYRVSLTGTTTIYLKRRTDFSAGTPQAIGSIRARRVR